MRLRELKGVWSSEGFSEIRVQELRGFVGRAVEKVFWGFGVEALSFRGYEGIRDSIQSFRALRAR